VFHKENGKSTPAAVVGFQFQHNSMQTLFRNITSNCTEPSCATCANDNYACYVLDDNGYVVISPDITSIGKFFGEVRGMVMHQLIAEYVYRVITIYDYQAICFIAKDPFNVATRMLTVCILIFLRVFLM
jgi:voltage-dependent calcium channel alpha-2/delta-3